MEEDQLTDATFAIIWGIGSSSARSTREKLREKKLVPTARDTTYPLAKSDLEAIEHKDHITNLQKKKPR